MLKPITTLRLFLTALLVGVLALGALQAPASAATKRSLSVAASPTAAVVKKAVTISGALTKSPRGSAVSIQRKVGKKWVTAKTTRTTTSTGKYAARVAVPAKPGTYSYRAFAPAKGSLKAAVSKTIKISALTPVVATIKASPKPPASLTAGGNATLSGTVKPFVANATVTIQKFVNSKWISTGVTAKLTSKGTFSRAIRVTDGSVFRVYVPRVGLKASTFSVGTPVIANPAISTTSLPTGSQNAAYTAQLTQVGSNPGTWGVNPALPAGLSLNTGTGKITGTPSGISNASYTFTFAQPGLVTASKSLNLTVTAPVPPTISTTSLPTGDKNVDYSTTLTASGNPTGTWTAAPLPAGLTLNPSTGVISGTPTAAGSTNVAIGFTQTNTGLSATPKNLSLVINPLPGPSIRTTSLPNGAAGGNYEFFLQASGGVSGTWSLVSGSLPPLYNLTPGTGRIAGNTSVLVLTDTTYNFTVGFTNADGTATPVQLSLTILTSGSLNNAIVSAGGNSTCRIAQDRSLSCWGYDDAGQLGNGGVLTVDPPAVNTPAQVGSGTDWTAISVSDDDLTTEGHACGLRGTAGYCWGSNAHGMLGIGTINGSEQSPASVSGSLAWSDISAGWTHTCGVTTAGALYCWGDNSFGQVGIVGGDRSVPTQVGAASDWESVSAGYTSSCAIKTTGTLYCWGMNSRGQLGIGNTDSQATPTKVGSSTWTSVEVGAGFACGRQVDGSVWCWGPSSNGQLGNGVVLNDSSTDVKSPAKVGTATNWVTLSTGKGHTCATNVSGELWCWGANGSSQLGDNTTTTRSVPTKIGSATDWQSVSAGASHSCAVKTDGGVWCWGSNFKGKTGTGSASAVIAVPTAVVG